MASSTSGSSRVMREGSAESDEAASDRVQVPNFEMFSDIASWSSNIGSDSVPPNGSTTSSVTAGPDGDAVVGTKKKFKTNAERLQAITMARDCGIYQACIYYEVSEQTIRKWIKCEPVIQEMDPVERKYYLQQHNVPEELKEIFAWDIQKVHDEWPLNIKDVKNRFRFRSKQLGFPAFAAVPGLHTFLKAFKAEYRLEGSFVVN